MIKQAILTQTGAATRTAKFVAVANVIPALTALYGSIDELKHSNVSCCRSRARSDPEKNPLRQCRQMRLSTLALNRAMKNRIGHRSHRPPSSIQGYPLIVAGNVVL